MAALRTKKLKGGSIVYFVDFTYQGKRYRKSTKTDDRKLAEAFLKELEVKIDRDNLGFDDLNKKKIRLSEFTDEYLRFSQATKGRNTYLLDQHALKLLKYQIGNVRLNSIISKQIEKFKIKRVEEVKPVSVNIYLKHLKAAFEKAVEWKYIDHNPCKRVKLFKIKDSNYPKFFTREEVNILLDAIPEGNFKNLIQFYLYTGSRRNEALSLDWKEIDLEENKVILKETKSGDSRVVPFNGVLTGILKSMEQNGEKPFPFKPDYVTHKFKKYLRSTKIENKEELNVHSLRHTFASHLVMSGVDLYTVSKLLGHSSVKVTEMYAHLMPDHLKAAIDCLRY